MATWFTTTTCGKLLLTFLISMMPVVELRGGLPAGIAMGLSYSGALCAAILGNLFPVPFIIVYLERFLSALKKHSRRFLEISGKLERRAHLKGRIVKKYSAVGLFLLVAIPLPGTGAWTGALVAVVLGMEMRRAFPMIILAVIAAAVIISGIATGVAYLI